MGKAARFDTKFVYYKGNIQKMLLSKTINWYIYILVKDMNFIIPSAVAIIPLAVAIIPSAVALWNDQD